MRLGDRLEQAPDTSRCRARGVHAPYTQRKSDSGRNEYIGNGPICGTDPNRAGLANVQGPRGYSKVGSVAWRDIFDPCRGAA